MLRETHQADRHRTTAADIGAAADEYSIQLLTDVRTMEQDLQVTRFLSHSCAIGIFVKPLIPKCETGRYRK